MRQFLIVPAEHRSCRVGYRHFEAGSWCLIAEDDLAVTPVLAGDNLCGYLLGDAIDLDAALMVRGAFVAGPLDPDLDGWVERTIYSLGGSFAFLFANDGLLRFYADAAASLPAVYVPGGAVASTAYLLLGEEGYIDRLDPQLRQHLEVEAHGWVPAGLTAHRGVMRVMPNHYIDLAIGSAVRHWPIEPLSPIPEDAALDILAANALASVKAVNAGFGAVVGLTAGNETRMILASVRPIASEVAFVTVAAPGAELDREIAGRLARSFGLQHRELAYVEASEAQQESWRLRVGHSMAGGVMKMHPSMFPIAGRCFVGGAAGEIGRGFLWMGSSADLKLEAKGVLDRLKLRHHPRLVEAVTQWLNGIPAGLDVLSLLDLAYLELRVGSWAAVQSGYQQEDIREIWPFASRASIIAMMSLPQSVRREDRLGYHLVARKWPELLNVPINRYGDWRDRTRVLSRVIKQPKRLLTKLRQLGRVFVSSVVAR